MILFPRTMCFGADTSDASDVTNVTPAFQASVLKLRLRSSLTMIDNSGQSLASDASGQILF
jgi:hypothetical protein